MDFTILPIDNYLRAPGLRLKCLKCSWESKIYRENESLYFLMQDVFQNHGTEHED